MTIAIVSDTHVPDREASIPESFRERIAAADHAIHAGDFTDPAVLSDLRDLAADLTAVHGNMDPDDIGLPSVATLTVDGLTFVVTHGTVRTREAWLDHVAETARTEADEPRVGIGGHSHQLEDVVHDGVRLLNPGTVTGAAPGDRPTMLTAEAIGDEVEVTVHERE